jgi:hypothetical protein
VAPRPPEQPPLPDAHITELEDRWIEKHGIPESSAGQLETKMASLSIKEAALPLRPRFGTGGEKVTLWANYFRMRPTVKSLYKYDLHITSKRMTEEEAEAAKGKGKGKGKPNQPQSGDGQQGEAKEPKGKKLEKIIQVTLTKLGTAVAATDYKQQLVTLKQLQLPEDNIMQVDLVEPGRRAETWFVRFSKPASMDIDRLMTYLQTLEDPGNETVFPKFPEEIDALGIVLGHTPRSSKDTAAVGRNRFFAVDAARKEAPRPEDMPYGSLIEILRGYVQSVRPATGRLLLNTNVTHGVFRKAGSLAALFKAFKLVNVNEPDKVDDEARQNLERLHKFLSKARIRCSVPGERPGETVEIERTMAGLATTRDGRDEERPPVFRHANLNFRFAAPTTVEFHLRRPSTPGATPPPGLNFGDMVLVSAYYKASKYLHLFCSSWGMF